MRQRSVAVFEVEAVNSEVALEQGDLLRNGLRGTNVEGTLGATHGVELAPGSRAPAALGTDPVALLQPVWKELLTGSFVGVRNESRRVRRDLAHRMPVLGHRFPVQVD